MIQFITHSFITSTRLVFKNLKLVLLLFIVNFSFALALTLPIFSMLRHSLLHSSLNAHFTGEFDYIWFLQFSSLNKQALADLPGLLYIITIIYNLIQLFFSGGLMTIFNNPQKDHIVDFFFGGVKYFFRFFKLFCVALVFYFLLITLNAFLNAAIVSMMANSQNVFLEFVIQLLRYVLFILLIGIINIIFDYSRVITVVDEKIKVLKVIGQSAVFIKNNFRLVASVYFITGSCVILATIIYNVFDNYIPKTSLALLIVTFFIQQLLIIFRLTIKMLFSASEIVVYNDLNAEIIDTSVEEISSGM
jgi:hypothetical protein